MSLRSLLRTGVAAAGLAVAGFHAPAALAADVTQAQAAVLEAQIRQWVSSMGGTVSLAGPQPLSVRPAGNHFDVAVPLRMTGPVRGDIQVSGTATPGENGRWSVAGIRTAVPLRLVADLPAPKKEGEKGPPKTTPITYTVNTEAQDGGGSYDPTFNTPSNWNSTLKGMTIQAEGADMRQTSAIANASGTSTLTPRDGGRLDFATNGTLTGYRLDSLAAADTPAIAAQVDKVEVTAAINGISRARALDLINIATAANELTRKAGPGAPPKLPPALMAQLIAALQDLTSDMNLAESFQGVKMNVGGMDFAMDQLRFAMTGKSEQGLMRVGLDLGYGGLVIPDFGLGEAQDLVPRALSLRPFVTGVAAADLARLATALNDGRDPNPAEIAAVFGHGGVVYGVDSLTFDMGASRFTSDGKVTMASVNSFTGAGRVTAENFDALVQKLGTVPPAQQIMPAVLFVKGIGRNEGGKLVWDIAWNEGKLTVNNMDLSAMVGATGGQGGGAAKGPAPRQQNRTR